jgi:hypothetical protein
VHLSLSSGSIYLEETRTLNEAKQKTRKFATERKAPQKERNAIHSGETNKMSRKANLD